MHCVALRSSCSQWAPCAGGSCTLLHAPELFAGGASITCMFPAHPFALRGHLGHFWFGALKNKVAVNVQLQLLFVWTQAFVSSGWRPGRQVAGLPTSCRLDFVEPANSPRWLCHTRALPSTRYGCCHSDTCGGVRLWSQRLMVISSFHVFVWHQRVILGEVSVRSFHAPFSPSQFFHCYIRESCVIWI